MSFPRYQRYKDSGVEWLGEVPEHWRVTVLKHLTAKIGSGITPRGGGEVYTSDGVVFLRSQNVYDDGLRLEEVVYIHPDLDGEMSRTRVRPGDILMNLTGASLGRTCLVPDNFANANVNQHVCIIRLKSLERRAFIAYALKSISVKTQIDFAQTGAAREGLNFEQIGSFQIAQPPLTDEAKAIATFLDRETAKIDALIEEQRRLIALLKEKRQAVISHAVTKGLNPAAPMKDSGWWYGKVPLHWRMHRIKRLLAVLTDYTANGSFASLAESVTYLPSGHSRLVRLTDLRENLANDGLYVDEGAHLFLKKSELFGGEVLIANVGAYAGYACLMPLGIGKATLGPNMYLTRFQEQEIMNDFALLCLTSYNAQEQLRLSATSTAQPKLNKDDIRGCVIVVPPTLEEQQEILSFVKKEDSRLERLQSEASGAIELLKERRSALISAAVTGKIDVRNYSPRETPSHEEVYEPA